MPFFVEVYQMSLHSFWLSFFPQKNREEGQKKEIKNDKNIAGTFPSTRVMRTGQVYWIMMENLILQTKCSISYFSQMDTNQTGSYIKKDMTTYLMGIPLKSLWTNHMHSIKMSLLEIQENNIYIFFNFQLQKKYISV